MDGVAVGGGTLRCVRAWSKGLCSVKKREKACKGVKKREHGVRVVVGSCGMPRQEKPAPGVIMDAGGIRA